MEYKEHPLEEIDFQKYWLVLQRRWLVAAGVCGVVVALAGFYASSLKPTYTTEASLLIKANRTSSLTGVGGEDMGRLERVGETSSPLDTQAKIVTSSPIIDETARVLNLKKGLPGKLNVEDVKGTDLLKISYTDINPEKAAKVVNTLIDIYIKYSIQANRAEAVSARKFILAQLPRTEANVRLAESALREFKEKNQVVVLQEEATAVVTTISDLEKQIADAKAELADVTARLVNLQKEAELNGQKAAMNAELSTTPGIQTVLAQLQEAESELRVKQTLFESGHPQILNLEEKVVALKRLLQERITEVKDKTQQGPNFQVGNLRQKVTEELVNTETLRRGLEQRIAQLSATWLAYKQRVSSLPKLEQTQRELERRQKAAQVTYEILLTKLQEIQVAENQNVGNARVIAPAKPPEDPDTNKGKLFIAGGGIVGAMLGIIVAFAVDLVDSSVKTLREARGLFKYTLLGVIPSIKRNGKNSGHSVRVDPAIPRVIGRDIPQFPIGDAYQILQANLRFLSSDKEIKAIVVTSSIAKEGKSEVSANLAVAMAQVGHRVLLVDGDMRHPMQHNIWELTNAVGLSNVMVDKIPLNTTVQEVMPNLYVLPSGVVPPNPVALLDSKRMAALVDTFTKEYDYVIFDTPSLSGTADAAVLSRLADGILLVVRPGVVDFARASAAKEFLTQSGQQVLGMVINGVDVKREPDSYFYYTQEQMEVGAVSQNSLSHQKASVKGHKERR